MDAHKDSVMLAVFKGHVKEPEVVYTMRRIGDFRLHSQYQLNRRGVVICRT